MSELADYERDMIAGPAMAEVNVQWKGVDICADVQCACSADGDRYEFHIDGFVFGRFTCPRCWRSFQLPWTQRAFQVASLNGEHVLGSEEA